MKSPIEQLMQQLMFPGCRTQGTELAIVHPPRGTELISLKAADGANIAALFGAGRTSTNSGLQPTLLFFYGNGMCMAQGIDIFNQLRGLGFNVITVDYEGYGMSGGDATEEGCYAAADAAYDYLLTRKDVNRKKIIATGWSLGGAIAIDLANRRPVAGLATFSAFTNVADMGEKNGGGRGVLVPYHFDNLAKIPSITCPIFMAHGTEDPLVPPEMLDRLAKAAKSKVTVTRVDGARHNDLFQTGGDVLFHRLAIFVNALPEKELQP